MKAREMILALIGKGKWGQNYIKTISQMDCCHLQEKYIKTKDYSDLLDQSIDGIIIASPTSTHYEIAKLFLEHGFNLLIEKPVTQTYEEAKDLERIAKAQDAIAMCGHIQLYDPAIKAIQKNIERSGKINNLYYRGLQSPVREDCSVLEDWGLHPIYLFMHFAQSNPKHISAHKTKADNIRLEIEFENGIVGIADVGWTANKRERIFGIEGSQEKITLDGSNNTRQLYFTDSNSKQMPIDFQENPTALENQIFNFAHCIQTQKQSPTPLSQGVEVTKILQKAKQSLESNSQKISFS